MGGLLEDNTIVEMSIMNEKNVIAPCLKINKRSENGTNIRGIAL
jgi:hypothetical protein